MAFKTGVLETNRHSVPAPFPPAVTPCLNIPKPLPPPAPMRTIHRHPLHTTKQTALPTQTLCRYRFLGRLGPRPPEGSSSFACRDRIQRQTRGRRRRHPLLGRPAFHPLQPTALASLHNPRGPPRLGSNVGSPCWGRRLRRRGWSLEERPRDLRPSQGPAFLCPMEGAYPGVLRSGQAISPTAPA